MQKYLWNHAAPALIVLFLTLLFACTHHPLKNEETLQIDSLLAHAKDSLYHNNEYSKLQYKTALKQAKDSDTFYKVLAEYSTYYYAINSYDTALAMNKRLLLYADKHPLSPLQHDFRTSANNFIGNYYTNKNRFDSAIYYYKIALTHGYRKADRATLPDICINLGDVYTRKGDYVRGVTFFRKALFISDSLHISDKMGFPIYFGLGQAYYTGMRNFQLSDVYFKKAEKQLESRALSEKFVFCNNRGNYYYYKEEYANALPWFLKAKALVTEGHYDYSINLCNANLGDIYLQLNKLDSAEYYLNKSYAYFRDKGIENILYYIATVKAGVALKQNDTKKAFSLLKQYSTTTNVEPTIVAIRNKYLQNYYARIGDFQHAYDYQSYNQRQNDSIRSEKVNNLIAETDLRFEQDTALIKRKYLIDQQTAQIKTLRLINLFGIVLAIAVVVIFVFAYINYKRSRDLQRVRFMEANTKLRLQNIRNRISPHFIFNVLSREISTEEDKEKHLEMIGLVKFLRRSLEITEQTAVTLEEEMEFVRNYLQMEQRSLGAEFQMEWKVDNTIDTSQLLIPAMIMQIPVENALKHALRPRQGEKRLRIEITSLKSYVRIRIEDNGEGYHPGIQSNSRGTGTGLKVLYQTIDILNTKNQKKISFHITNIQNETTTGTRVEINIPTAYSYEL